MCRSKFYTWYNRSGNPLMAGINLIKYAFYLNNHRGIIVPDHNLFNFTKENLLNF